MINAERVYEGSRLISLVLCVNFTIMCFLSLRFELNSFLVVEDVRYRLLF